MEKKYDVIYSESSLFCPQYAACRGYGLIFEKSFRNLFPVQTILVDKQYAAPTLHNLYTHWPIDKILLCRRL